MAFQNPIRPRCAALLGTSVALYGAVIGCNVYDDELLRRPTDGGSALGDVAGESADAATMDVAPPLDGAINDSGDATALDVIPTDVVPDRDTGTTTEASAPDGAVGDAGPPHADADAARGDTSGTLDALDAPLDAITGSSDADAGPRPPDANDAGADASGGADADARDGGSVLPDGAIDADGGIAPPTFRVVRVGEGTTQPSSASAAVFIEERAWDGHVVGQPLPLPTSPSGGQHPLTLSGIATSEGALSLSLDGRYLTLAGYATAPGRANVATSTDVERVVARVEASGLIDTTTLLGDAYSGSNVRSAASLDGAAFWTGGSAGGVWYSQLGGSGLTQIVASPDNVRLVALFGDQLYGCSGASQTTGVFTVGNGRPTSGVQNVAVLTGLPRSGISPYAFALFDLDPAVAGLDTLYLTDDRSPESDGNGGGIHKWTLQGSTWTRVATFTAVGSGSASFRGLAGAATSAGVILLASTSEMSANRLVVFVDDGSPNATGRVVATASSNTIFRGVALSPHP